jgi:hypothetical protein
MGYLIDNTTTYLTNITVIKSADVQQLDNTPKSVLNGESGFFLIPIFIGLKVLKNSTTAYLGYSHIYITSSPFGKKNASFDAAGGNILGFKYYNVMDLYMSHPPNVPGGTFKENLTLYINFSTPITAGDGDLEVTIYYYKFAI